MADLPPIVARVEGDVADLVAKIEEAKAELASLPDEKTVDIRVAESGALGSIGPAFEQASANAANFGTGVSETAGRLREAGSGASFFAGSLAEVDRAMQQADDNALNFHGGMDEVVRTLEAATTAAEADTAATDGVSRSNVTATDTSRSLASQLNAVRGMLADNESGWVRLKGNIDGAAVSMTALVRSAGGGDGGGGGIAALLAGAFMGKGGGTRIPFTGLSVPAFGSIGALAGLGGTSLLGAGAGIGLSGAGALVGGGLLGLGAAGVGAVGAGTNAAGLGQAAGDIKSVTDATNNLNKAIAEFGAGSTQAQHAQNLLNFTLQGFSPIAQQAVQSAANAVAQFKTLFDTATGEAEKTGAEIIQQAVEVGGKFIPTIGKFAAENMNILQQSLQPFFGWLQGAGLGIFTDLEIKFQHSLPTAIHATEQAFELFAKTIDVASNFTGGFLPKIDAFVTKFNGADFTRWATEIGRLIDLFHTWASFITEIGRVFVNLGKDFAGTGTSIIQLFTQILDKFNAYITSVKGSTAIHAVFEAHKNAILAVLNALLPVVEIMGKLELSVVPALANAFALVVRSLTPFIDLLASNPFTSFLLGLGLIELKTHALTQAFSLVKAAISGAFGLVDFAKTAAAWMGIGTAAQTSANEIDTAGARAVAGGNEFAAAGARAEQGSLGFLGEGTAAGTAATEIDVAGARAAEGGAGFTAAGAEADTAGAGLFRFSNMTKLLTSGGASLPVLAGVLGVAAVGFAGFWEATHRWNDEAFVTDQHARQLGVSVQQLNSAVQDSTGPSRQFADNVSGVRQALAATPAPARDTINNVNDLKNALNNTAPPVEQLQQNLRNSSNTMGGLQKILNLTGDQVKAFATDAGISAQQLASAQGPAIFKQHIADIASGAQAADPIVRTWANTMLTELNATGTAAAKNSLTVSSSLGQNVDSFERWANVVGFTMGKAQQDTSVATSEMERQWQLTGNQTLENTLTWSAQMQGEFANAMRLVELEMQNGGNLSVKQLADALHIGEPQVEQILGDYKLQFDGTTKSMVDDGNKAGTGFATGANATLLAGLGPLVTTLGGYDEAIRRGLNPLLAAIGQNQIIASSVGAPGGRPAPGSTADQILGSSLNIHPTASGGFGRGGGLTDGPTFLVGEGNPAHPEVVIASDPQYHDRNVALWQTAGKMLGMEAGGCAGGCSGGSCGGSCKGLASGGFLGGFDTGGIPFLGAPAAIFGSPDGGGTGGAGLPMPPVPPGGFASGADVPKPTDGFYNARGTYGGADDSLANIVYQGAVRIANQAAAARAAAAQGAGMGGVGPAVTGACGDWINQGLALAGASARMSASCLMARAMNESGCNPGAVNRTDSNAAAGHPSVGLMQFVPSTFAANSVAGCTDLMNPICQVAASAHCDPGNCGHGGYGCASGCIVPTKSFDTGGYLQPGLTLAYNGTGSPEPVGKGAGGVVWEDHRQINLAADFSNATNRSILQRELDRHDKHMLQQLRAMVGGA